MIMSASIGFACLILFGLVRHHCKVYRTRLFHPRVAAIHRPPPLRATWNLFGWVLDVVNINQRTLYDTAGLDALYFDRSNLLMLKVIGFVAVVNCGVVMPVNYLLGEVITDEAITIGNMSPSDKLSMTNIPIGSALMWIHAAVVVLTTFFVCALLYVDADEFRADRHAWLGHSIQAPRFEDEETNQSTTSSVATQHASLDGGSGRLKSLLSRQLSSHIQEAECSACEHEPHDESSVEEKSENFDDFSRIHSEMSIFQRQHVFVPGMVGSIASSRWAVKAQQYAVLVTNVTKSTCVEVSTSFRSMFPDVIAAVPVLHHVIVDKNLEKLDQAQLSLLRLEERISTSRNPESERMKKMLSRREFLKEKISSTFSAVKKAQEDSKLDPRSGYSYIILFRSQASATIAAQTLLQDPGGDRGWNVAAAPAPDDVNFQSLWLGPGQRWYRSIVALVTVAFIVSFPIGVFTSSMVALSAALCSKNSDILNSEWYCDNDGDGKQSFFFRLLTAWIPSLLLATWNAVVVPFGFAFVALYEGSEITLSGIDRKVFRWFYLYSCLNVLAGGMLAGSFFSQLENIIRTPSSIFTLLGYAVPQSSGFFLAYISTNAFMLEPLRLLLPHGGVLIWFATGCGRRFAWSGRITRDISAYFSPRSQRYGSNYGTQQLIFLICLVFSTASPVITPLGFAYFLLAWLVWRYQLCYVFIRAYESGALLFPALFSRIMFSLLLYQMFMSFYLLIKAAFVPAFVLWIIVPPFLWSFHSHCTRCFMMKSVYLPLAIAKEMPVASIPVDAYCAPQMHPEFRGWASEVGKAWQGYGPFVRKYV